MSSGILNSPRRRRFPWIRVGLLFITACLCWGAAAMPEPFPSIALFVLIGEVFGDKAVRVVRGE